MVRVITFLFSMPTLLPDETPATLQKRAAEQRATSSRSVDIQAPKSVTYTDYDDPFSMVNTSSGAPHIYKLSQLAWVGCGGDIYVLECLGRGHLRIEPMDSSEGRI